MENQEPNNHNRKTLRRGSNSHISMSDTESTTSQVDSWHSALRFDSPLHSDDPYFLPENGNHVNKSSKSLVTADKFYSPVPSPGKSNPTATSPATGVKGRRLWPQSVKPSTGNSDFPASPTGKGGRREKSVAENREFGVRGNSPVIVGLNKLVGDEAPPAVKKVGPVRGGGDALEEGYARGAGGEVGGERQSRTAVADVLRRSERKAAVRKLAMVFRVIEVIVCMISFSVMAADRTRGWSDDSFDRYREYRFCLAVNIIGFVYSGFQAYDLANHLGTEKHVISHHLRCHFDFSLDQILAYLLMSASSSAATRVTDWISNWGKDDFTLMATASIAMSFLAFVAFAVTSMISGYNLFTRHST